MSATPNTVNSSLRVRGNVEVSCNILIPKNATSNPTFYIGGGSNDDFASLQAAVDAVSVQTKRAGDPPVVLQVRDGYVLPGTLSCRNGTFSHIVIKPEVAGNAVTMDSNAAVSSAPAIIDVNDAAAPVLECRIDAQNVGGDGVRVRGPGAFIKVNAGGGVINAQAHGLVVADGAAADAAGSVFSSATSNAVRGESAGSVAAANIDGTFAGDTALYLTGASRAYLDGADFRDCAATTHMADISDFSGASLQGASFGGSSASDGLSVASSSTACANGLTFDGQGSVNIGVLAVEGASVNLNSANVYGWTDSALRVFSGSTAYVHNATTDAASTNAISPSDTNLSGFNTLTPGGIIYG